MYRIRTAGISQSQLDMLRELSWLDNCGNIVLAGPPGLGKTMVACGLGLQAVHDGYTVCFEKMSSLIRILDTAETERSAGFRLRNLKKAQLIIIDEIGYTPISRSQANRFFTFISDTYKSSSMIFTTNKEIVDWAEMMGDPVLTTAMLDRILHHARCNSIRGESWQSWMVWTNVWSLCPIQEIAYTKCNSYEYLSSHNGSIMLSEIW